jgi:hypothetical protein
MFVFKKYDRQNRVWSFMTKYLRFLCKFTSWSGETPYNIDFFYMHLFTMRNPIRTLIILVQDQNISLKLPVGVSPLQLVNLHRNRRYFVIKLHTRFCLSYFLKTNIKFYCIYQNFISINSFFKTLSVSRYSRPITVTRDPL